MDNTKEADDGAFIAQNIAFDVVIVVRDTNGIIRLITKDGRIIRIYAVKVNSDDPKSSVGIFYKMGDCPPIMLMCGTKEVMINRLNSLADSMREAISDYRQVSRQMIARDADLVEDAQVVDTSNKEMENFQGINSTNNTNRPFRQSVKTRFDILGANLSSVFSQKTLILGAGICASLVLVIGIHGFVGRSHAPQATPQAVAYPRPSGTSNASRTVVRSATPHGPLVGPFNTPIIPSGAGMINRSPPSMPGGGTLKSLSDLKFFGLID